MKFPDLASISFENRRVLIRVDFNVPLKNGRVVDDSRIRAALPTLKFVASRGGKLVLMSHLGRPKGKPDPTQSLAPVAEHLQGLWHHKVHFIDDCIGLKVVEATQRLESGEILVLENLRFHQGETEDSQQFAVELAKNGDVYVNDAFGAAHRAHASVHAIAYVFDEKAIGLLMNREITNLSRLLHDPEHPFVTILGGAKVKDKLPVIRNLIGKVDTILLGGAMCYTFMRALDHDTGRSPVEMDQVAEVKAIMQEAKGKGVSIEFPEDHRVSQSLEDFSNMFDVITGKSFRNGFGVDIGRKTLARYTQKIKKARTVFWNGPMGIYEKDPCAKGTQGIAHAVADCSGFTGVGGGDSLAVLAGENLLDKVTHASTGGGASLEFIAGVELPGLTPFLGP